MVKQNTKSLLLVLFLVVEQLIEEVPGDIYIILVGQPLTIDSTCNAEENDAKSGFSQAQP